MMDFMEEMGLRHFGFNDQQMAQIDAAIPKVAVLMDFIRQHKTMINQLIDTATMIADQAQQFKKGQTQ